MKVFLLIFLFLSPLRQVEFLNVLINTDQVSIFMNYSNDNFKQKLENNSGILNIETESLDYSQLDLNFRVIPDDLYLDSLSTEMKLAAKSIIKGAYNLNDYMKNLSFFLKNNIKYSLQKSPQDAESVLINKRGHCVGFSSLTKVFLKTIGVESNLIQGFYLKKRDGKIIPIPHKWLEIELANGFSYFYDPQYQKFSSNYIVVDNSVMFSNIRKFSIKLVDFTKKILN